MISTLQVGMVIGLTMAIMNQSFDWWLVTSFINMSIKTLIYKLIHLYYLKINTFINLLQERWFLI